VLLFGKNWLSCNATQSRVWDLNFVNKPFIVKINLFDHEVNFYKVVWIIVCKHLEIYTKTISRLRLGDYKPIFTSPSAQWI
jgi:predicted nucleic-acid-binding Zn-ribbon protein